MGADRLIYLYSRPMRYSRLNEVLGALGMTKTARVSRGRSLGVTQLSASPSQGGERAHLTLRIDFGPYGALGPGKIKLLELIEQHGSITAAGKRMDMSYRRAWLLVNSIN